MCIRDSSDEAGKRQLIEPDETDAQKPPRRFGKGAAPVAGSPGLYRRLIMPAARFAAHGLTRGVESLPAFDLVERIDHGFESQHGGGVAGLEIPDR